jgi:hypothetical protein
MRIQLTQMGMQWDIKKSWDMTRINQHTSRFKRDDTGKKSKFPGNKNQGPWKKHKFTGKII